MRLALVLFEYFPHGGLQRDFWHVARLLIERGHDVTILTRSWEGERLAGAELNLVPSRAWTNVGRDREFIQTVAPLFASFDGVVGFQKMPGLDVYYAADPCHAQRLRQRSGLIRVADGLSSRNKQRSDWERAVFAHDSKTVILLLAHDQRRSFQEHYQTQDERFHELPPNLTRSDPVDRVSARDELRRELGLTADANLLLSVGSSFRTKGVDRSIRALAKLGEAYHLVIAGDGKRASCEKLARGLELEDRVHFVGPRSDVPMLYAAADLLLHPARHENTGTVILEALTSGLPVIASGTCGFASHVRAADAGFVLSDPFAQSDLEDRLGQAIVDVARMSDWRENGIRYGEQTSLYSGHAVAAQRIESTVRSSQNAC